MEDGRLLWHKIFQYAHKPIIMNQQDKNQQGRGQQGSQRENVNKEDQNNRRDQQNDKNREQQGGLTKEDLPDATNESTGKMGSGQRQDSN